MSDNDKMLNDAIQEHRDLLEYYDAMGCKDDVTIQERYIGWLAELQEHRAVSVKHGHWIDKGVLENYPRPDINVYHLLWCSECGALHRVRPYCEGGWINANYCPNCGAKMSGDADA